LGSAERQGRGVPSEERPRGCEEAIQGDRGRRRAESDLQTDQRSARGPRRDRGGDLLPSGQKARSEEVKDEVREAYEEHKQVKTLLADISEISPDDESDSAKIKVLKEDVEHHVKEEEGEMFPDARKYLRDKLEDLGAQMRARKDELETNVVPEAKHGPTGKRGGRSNNGKSKEA